MLSDATTHATLLVRLGGEGDETAWLEFHDRYAELIRRFAVRCGLQPADCDDVLQEVMLALAKFLPNFEYDPAKGRFRHYLARIARHVIGRRICQKRGEIVLEDPEKTCSREGTPPIAEDAWEEEWRQYHLRRAMRTIQAEFNRRDVDAFGRYVAEGDSPEVVAAELAMSVASVYQAKSRILRRLRQLIASQVREEG